jgi:hypothetical protein
MAPVPVGSGDAILDDHRGATMRTHFHEQGTRRDSSQRASARSPFGDSLGPGGNASRVPPIVP